MTPENQTKKSSWTVTRVGAIVAGAILGFAIIYTLIQGDRAKPPVPGGLPDSVMQANINRLDGQTIKLGDYSGKVLVVDVWATWCGPCVQEIPHLIQIADEYKGKGVEVIGLTKEDPQNTVEDVKQFYKDFKINYPVGWVDAQLQDELMQGRGAIPQTYIIGRDGKILKHFTGFSRVMIPQMKAALDQAISEG